MIKNGGFYPLFFCKEKADGIKPSALTVLTIKLESEYEFRPENLIVGVAFTRFEVSIFNTSYNVFSKGYISANIKAFIAVTIYYISRIFCITTAEYSRLEISCKWTIAVVSI